ncbi:MAG: PAS domain S-box protein [Desulfobacterales bacterium]|nr:PAS domain S-box protein [Desulfobacterales bacterium]
MSSLNQVRRIFQAFFDSLDKWTRPQAHLSQDSLVYWRERIVWSILLTGVIFGGIAFVPSVRLCIKEGRWLVVFFDTAIYAMVVILFFVRQIPFIVRAYAIIIGSYILGMVLMLVIGPSASGPLWLFAFPIIAGIILGIRAAFAALGLNILSLAVIGAMLGSQAPPWIDPAPHTMERWFVISLNFILLNAVAALSLAIVQRGLAASLSIEKTMRESIQKQMDVRMQAEKARRASEERLSALVENAPIGIFWTTAKGKGLDGNPEMARMVACASPEEARQYFTDLSTQLYVDPGDREDILTQIKEKGYAENVEYEAYRADGSTFWMLVNARINRRISEDDFEIEGFAADITQRKQYEEKLLAYQMAIESSGDFIAIVDENYVYQVVNSAYAALQGRPKHEIVGRPVAAIMGENFFQTAIKSSLDRCLAGENLYIEEKRLHPKLGVIDLAISYYPLRSEEQIIGVVALLRDITEYKAAESELIESREQLRGLSAHLEEVREKERAEIARMLHDELGQALTGLRIDTLQLGQKLRAVNPELAESTDSMVTLIDYLNNKTRQLVADLRPGMLDDLGLIPALEWYVDHFMQRTGIHSVFSTNTPEQELADETATGIYRICQEALTNVYRHAAASRVEVELTVGDGQIALEIRDNGVAIDLQRINTQNSFGILGMRERAWALGGTLTVDRARPSGTTVRVQVPISL